MRPSPIRLAGGGREREQRCAGSYPQRQRCSSNGGGSTVPVPLGVEGKTTDVIHGGRSICLFVANVLKQRRCIKSEVNHLR